jgi:hypothetical protein
MDAAVDTLAFLLGAWRLERTITDHRSGTAGSFNGEATLIEIDADGGSSIPERAHYEELGELRFGAHGSSARRTLDYVRLSDGSVLLCFADGRPFIELDLRAGTCRRTHDCGEDVYEIEMAVISDDLVEERWRVRGPAKDYSAVTALSRK